MSKMSGTELPPASEIMERLVTGWGTLSIKLGTLVTTLMANMLSMVRGNEHSLAYYVDSLTQ